MENVKEMKGRTIGIKHRVKITAEREERPTMVAIKDGNGDVVCHSLKTETDELDFLLERFPTSHRKPKAGDVISSFRPHQLRWRMLKEDEDLGKFPKDFMKEVKGKQYVAEVPETFDGLKKGDTVLMTFGGSGDRLAFAFAKRGDNIGARLLRVPPSHLKNLRESMGEIGDTDTENEAEAPGTEESDVEEEAESDADAVSGKKVRKADPKKNDHKLIIRLFETNPGVFFQVYPRDLKYTLVAEAFRARQDAMKDRIICQQRIFQGLIGRIFLTEDGQYPEGEIEQVFNSLKANDNVLQWLIRREGELDKRYRRAVRELDIWNELTRTDDLKGFGERHAAGIITAVVDIRRFMGGDNGPARLAKFCGAHVEKGGILPRKRRGKQCSWNPMARQSLFLLADQWVYRPNTVWGQQLLANKEKFRQKHPEAIRVRVLDPKRKGKTKLVWRYNKGHIHKMAMWRTRTQFIKWLYRKWVEIEMRHREETPQEQAAT